MSSVKRYSIVTDSMDIRAKYVLASDYDALRADIEALRGSCAALGKENTLMARRIKKLERALQWFVGLHIGAMKPKWLQAVMASLSGGRS